jgi:lsr operon transcriptional repressor
MSSLQHLSGFISSQQIRLVTLSGGVGPYMTGIGQLDAACSVSMIPRRCACHPPKWPGS